MKEGISVRSKGSNRQSWIRKVSGDKIKASIPQELVKLVPHYLKKSFPISQADVVPSSIPEHSLGSGLLSITSTYSTFQSPQPWRGVLSPCLALPLGSSLGCAPVFLQARSSPLDMFCLLSPFALVSFRCLWLFSLSHLQ